MSVPNTTSTKVAKFHRVFGHPIAPSPTTDVSLELRKLRLDLILEELHETAYAMGFMLAYRPEEGKRPFQWVQAHGEVDLVEVADGLGDLDYVIAGAALVFGIPHDKVVDAIQRSNMSKLGADGKPIYRADGKILKGPAYVPPTEEIRLLLIEAGADLPKPE